METRETGYTFKHETCGCICHDWGWGYCNVCLDKHPDFQWKDSDY